MSEILLPLNATCRSDNQCSDTCCSNSICQVSTVCKDSRYTMMILFSIFCVILIIAGVTAYFFCMKKRRNTRYDERLNSIRTDSLNNHDLLTKPLTANSKGAFAGRAINHQSINEEDLKDFD